MKKLQVTLDLKVAVYTELLELIGQQMVLALKRPFEEEFCFSKIAQAEGQTRRCLMLGPEKSRNSSG